MSKLDKTKKLKKKIEGYDGFMEVSRSDYIISGDKGRRKRYLKTDTSRVVKIYDGSSSKYFLMTDPMVKRLFNGGYGLTVNCVYCECRTGFVDKTRTNVELVNGKYYLERNVVRIGTKKFWILDESICVDYLNGRNGRRNYLFKSDCVELHPGIYGLPVRMTSKQEINQLPLVSISNPHKGSYYYARESDSIRMMMTNGEVKYYTDSYARDRGRLKPCFVGFINKDLNSFDNNVKIGFCLDKYTGDNKYFTYHEQTDKYVHVNDYAEYSKIYDEWYKNSVDKNVKKAIIKANNSFSDCDDDENSPSFMRFNRDLKPRWGGNIGYDGRKPFAMSSTTTKVGGIGYTFGVEIETSDGFLSNSEINNVGLCSMGDNSILGNEYITQALHGDLGLEILEKQMKIISDRCVVDDTCSIHVHVGGWNSPKVVTPNFGVDFAINSIKLGCMIEEDLFKSQPVSRSPWKKHCHCITSNDGDYSGDFRSISKSNYKKLLGEYVFGTEIYRDIGSMPTPGRWADMRYKWLNLRNAICNGTDITTLELRIFAPTTSYKKVLQAVRISLAFVWFVENRQKLILEGGVSLVKMITEAYERYPSVLKEVLDYIEKRKNKFNRNNIYE
jgi:hypothetical protein